MTARLPRQEPYALRQTNVSNPSIIRTQPSQQSFAASEDYYSLSPASTHSSDTVLADDRGDLANPPYRPVTPSSLYRTPLQSRDQLPSQSRPFIDQARTPANLRDQIASQQYGGPNDLLLSRPAPAVLTEGGVRRKPVPATLHSPDSPESQQFIDGERARSSMAMDIARDSSPPTPGHDDTPYVRFALDQLTRDEEVRGSRYYGGHDEDSNASSTDGDSAIRPLADVPAAVAVAPSRGLEHPATEHWPLPSRGFDEPPPKSPMRDLLQRQAVRPGQPTSEAFVPVADDGRSPARLNFLPGLLRPLSLTLFALILATYIALLAAAAILSLLRRGLFDYGTLGDSEYFICEYLPTLLGIVLFLWLVQIEVAVFRIAPFIALASSSARSREQGAKLRLFPPTFFFCYFGHLRARQPVVTLFLVASWLQIGTIPLLGSAFNVHFYGAPHTGQWRWLATQGTTWAIVILYFFLLLSVVALMIWLRRQDTGLRWDPRTLADAIVLLERSNALTSQHDEELLHEPAKLGYWSTGRAGRTIFHTYGVPGKATRQYAVEGGRIREKAPLPLSEPRGRYTDEDAELGREQRHSRERMLPRRNLHAIEEDHRSGNALPWFLRPVVAFLWPIIAIALLLAFLIASYLPSIAVAKGFAPDLPAPVNQVGFSATNFLYSFIPGVLATICLLGWLDIDFAYRRLQPYAAMLQHEGEVAERSLLLSYTADVPGAVTASAMINGHLKVALTSFITLVAACLPIMAGGVFWSEFYVSSQTTRITVQTTAYHALSALLTIYALAYLFIFPTRALRTLDCALPPGNQARRFHDILDLVRSSRILDDVAFHSPQSRTDLVTRLLSAAPGAPTRSQGAPAAAASRASLADSVRGFGRARSHAGAPLVDFGLPRYYLGHYEGRDGRTYVGVDRVRS